jgi:hypothetical protein
MAKHYLLKRPEPKFEGRQSIVRDRETGAILDTIPDLSSGHYRSAWAAYELALQSITRGADILTIIQLRKKLQEASDQENALLDAKFVILTDVEKNYIVEAVKSFDWTFSKAKGELGSQFFVTWIELFEAVLDTSSAGYGLSEYDVSRPSEDYVKDIARFDKRKSELAAKVALAASLYEESRKNDGAPTADPVETTDGDK